jgi:hypothetical protein
VRKLAIFSESVGDWNVSFLQKHGIASVWKDGDSWAGRVKPSPPDSPSIWRAPPMRANREASRNRRHMRLAEVRLKTTSIRFGVTCDA